MSNKIRRERSAFTLVEIMIVVAIIGLLAALAIPGFVKARKQSQGRRIMNDCRQMDSAIDQWALETRQTGRCRHQHDWGTDVLEDSVENNGSAEQRL